MQLAELEALEAERMAVRADREHQRARASKQAEGAYGEAVVSLREARREVDQVRAELRAKAAAERARAEDLQRARRKIATASKTVHANQPEHTLPPGRAPGDGELVPGTPVILPGLGGRGEVVAAPERGRVAVRLGAMHTSVPVAEVLLDVHRKASQPAPARAERRPDGRDGRQLVDGATDGRAVARTLDTTLDVRGQRADDATGALDRFLDEAMLLSRETIFVIHGHGTGALRAAVRAHLKGHAAVQSFRPGGASEGGDGVTVVFLRS
jgi:DNA mismatch repair protein MutS2